METNLECFFVCLLLLIVRGPSILIFFRFTVSARRRQIWLRRFIILSSAERWDGDLQFTAISSNASCAKDLLYCRCWLENPPPFRDFGVQFIRIKIFPDKSFKCATASNHQAGSQWTLQKLRWQITIQVCQIIVICEKLSSYFQNQVESW